MRLTKFFEKLWRGKPPKPSSENHEAWTREEIAKATAIKLSGGDVYGSLEIDGEHYPARFLVCDNGSDFTVRVAEPVKFTAKRNMKIGADIPIHIGLPFVPDNLTIPCLPTKVAKGMKVTISDSAYGHKH